jgi:dsRNA-specific ribonuclease
MSIARIARLYKRTVMSVYGLAMQLPIKNLDLYKRALTSETALPNRLWVSGSYERDEWVGDKLAGYLISKMLCELLPSAKVSDLNMIRTRLESNVYMWHMASLLELDKFIVYDARV